MLKKNKIIIIVIIIILCLCLIYHIYKENNSIKKVFLTYGDKHFINSRQRIINEAKQLDLFTDCIMETENVFNDMEFKKQLKNERFKKVATSNRGGGYWLWKPYIVYKHLSKLNDGDILFFVDAGCKIDKNNQIKNIFEDLNSNKYNMTLNIYGDNEKIWSKGDALKYHNVENNENILNKGQMESGRVFMIKNKKTMEIISKWWDIAKNHPELFDDSKSVVPNKGGFIEHRHDQSNISILCKLNECCDGTDLEFIKRGFSRE